MLTQARTSSTWADGQTRFIGPVHPPTAPRGNHPSPRKLRCGTHRNQRRTGPSPAIRCPVNGLPCRTPTALLAPSAAPAQGIATVTFAHSWAPRPMDGFPCSGTHPVRCSGEVLRSPEPCQLQRTIDREQRAADFPIRTLGLMLPSAIPIAPESTFSARCLLGPLFSTVLLSLASWHPLSTATSAHPKQGQKARRPGSDRRRDEQPEHSFPGARLPSLTYLGLTELLLGPATRPGPAVPINVRHASPLQDLLPSPTRERRENGASTAPSCSLN